MKFSQNIEKAITTAAQLHIDQKRKDGEIPYIVHPFSVMLILSDYTDDESILIAGLLHDTLEDIEEYHYKDLERDFGKKVADIVEGVTQVKVSYDKKLPKEERVEIFEDGLKENLKKIEAGGYGSVLIAGADKIHNLMSMMAGKDKYGQEFFDKFKQPMEQKLRYYRDVLEIVKKYKNIGLSDRLEKTLKKAKEYIL